MRSVVVAGSTGSIGTQALDVVAQHPGLFTVVGLTAGSNLRLLAEQAVRFQVPQLALAQGDVLELRTVIAALAAAAGVAHYQPQIDAGPVAVEALAGCAADVVLNGITGAAGLPPTLAALRAGSTLALANKESLVMAGPLVQQLAAPEQIVPVDSEHSAIAQCLRSGRRDEVRRLLVTASGGPFRGYDAARLATVTPKQALAHPNFSMGQVITTNSATLVNKGLEVMEAHLLFGVPYADITVVVHPQQLIHSMVEFRDGSTIAQLGPPRMLVPIALGLSWPDRLHGVDDAPHWQYPQSWDFEPLDDELFPAVRLARQVGESGGTYPAVYNASNEVAVAAFHAGVIGFTDIVATVARVVEQHDPAQFTSFGADITLKAVLAADAWARGAAQTNVGHHR